jgi:hypothetical protein
MKNATNQPGRQFGLSFRISLLHDQVLIRARRILDSSLANRKTLWPSKRGLAPT